MSVDNTNEPFIGSDIPENSKNNNTYIGRDGGVPPNGGADAISGASDADYPGNNITKSTLDRGLKKVPATFEDTNGDWKTINSDNLFEVLYFDYQHYFKITDEMVKNNFEIISNFWQTKNRQFLGAQKERIVKKYGQAIVEQANKKLERAFNQLRNEANRKLYYKELETKRYNKGIESIADLIAGVLDAGLLPETTAVRIINRGIENGLNFQEAKDHLLAKIKEAGFKSRAKAESKENVFANKWMTDEVFERQANVVIKVNGREVHTLEEYGEVLFNDASYSSRHIQKGAIRQNVNTLTNDDDLAMEIDDLCDERDVVKKILKVIYALNPSLPYKLGEYKYYSLDTMLKTGFKDYKLYKNIETEFTEGRLTIWIQANAPDIAKKIPYKNQNINSSYYSNYNNVYGQSSPQQSYTPRDFLEFIYSVNNQYPFYLKKDRLLKNFQDLADTLKQADSYWNDVMDNFKNEYLTTWMKSGGRFDYINAYNNEIDRVFALKTHNSEEACYAGIQKLLETIDNSVSPPKLRLDKLQIDLQDFAPSNKIETVSIQVKMEGIGFTKSIYSLNKNIEGITLKDKANCFFSLTNNTIFSINVDIDTAKLLKGTLYKNTLKIQSAMETIEVPVNIKVVFPKKQFIRQLIKYGLIFGTFIGIINYLFVGIADSYEGQYGVGAPLFVLAVAFVGWFIWWIPAIKKFEKL